MARTRTTRIRRVAAVFGAAALVPLMVAAGTSQAEAATTYTGKTTVGLNIRYAPTQVSTKVGSLARGTTIKIDCKVFGPRIAGNNLWYNLTKGGWVSARYVDNIGAAPRYCGSGATYEGKVVSRATLHVRSGPNTDNAIVSSVPRGHHVFINCKVRAQNISGNTLWYALEGDSAAWVTARYVDNVGARPEYC